MNSNPELENLDSTAHQSRTSMHKRFNSTKARYKRVVNKIEGNTNKSLSQIRKWSQGQSYQ